MSSAGDRNVKRVLILAEGDTEEQFVKKILAPYLQSKDVFVIPKTATTRRMKGGPDFKGGVVSYGKVRGDIVRLLKDTNAFVTTMLDFFRLPSDFPGRMTTPTGTGYQRVAYLEEALREDIANRNFQPYLSLHEFEALLFAEHTKIAQAFSGKDVSAKLQAIRNEFGSPEEINDEEPPSKRILELRPRYRKPAHGISIAAEIGLDRIRAECPHFDQWVKQLEELGGR